MTWITIDPPGDLPDDVPKPPGPGWQWWGANAGDFDLYAATMSEGWPYLLLVYACPSGALHVAGRPVLPRYPTLPELATAAALLPEGASITLGLVTGPPMPEPVSGWRCVAMAGNGNAIEGSPAATRAKLLRDRAEAQNGGGIILPHDRSRN